MTWRLTWESCGAEAFKVSRMTAAATRRCSSLSSVEMMGHGYVTPSSTPASARTCSGASHGLQMTGFWV